MTVSKNSELHVVGMRVPWLLIVTVAQCGGSLISSFSGFAGTSRQRTDRELHKVIRNQAFQSDEFYGCQVDNCASAKLSLQSSTSSENSLEDAPVNPPVNEQHDSLTNAAHLASSAKLDMMETFAQLSTFTLIRRNLCKTPTLAHDGGMHTDERTYMIDHNDEFAREQNMQSNKYPPLSLEAQRSSAVIDSTTPSFNNEFAPRGPSDILCGTRQQSDSGENTTGTDRGHNKHTASHSFDLLLASISRLFDYTLYAGPHHKSRSEENFGQRPGYGRE